MISLAFSNATPVTLGIQQRAPSRTTCRRPPRTAAPQCSAAAAAAAGAGAEAPPSPPPPLQRELLKCLVCGEALPHAPHPAIDTLPAECPTCGAPLPRRAGYIDLTAQSRRRGALSLLPSVGEPVRSALFQLPNVSFAYERGWRDGFARAGFPGAPEEADRALDFLLPAAVLLDMSCGSGLIARRLAVSAPPETRVVAADFSAAMLAEASGRARRDPRVPSLDFFRADVTRLPFTDGAFDGVHAGAALHCWYRLQDALREIRRVLAPGAGFFATTFANDAYVPNVPNVSNVLRVLEDLGLRNPAYRFFDEEELTYLLRSAGFVDVNVTRLPPACLVVQARNPDSVQ